VVHIDRGIFTGFMNSRQTAAISGRSNGHWKATDAQLVPLVRMSTTVFAGGERDPEELIREIDHGYYLVGHRTPSIARAGRTSGSPRARSTRSGGARSDRSSVTGASWRTAATT